MNWFTSGFTTKKVGFTQDGNIYEGGACEHLHEGDRAHGYTSEHDSFGSEMHLMCKPCFEQYKVDRMNEYIPCSDCRREFPRKDLLAYTIYAIAREYEPAHECVVRICKTCQTEKKHKDRVEYDTWLRERDQDDD